MSGFRPCAGAVGKVVCLTLYQVVCTREFFKQPLSRPVTSCNSGDNLKKILGKRREKKRREEFLVCILCVVHDNQKLRNTGDGPHTHLLSPNMIVFQISLAVADTGSMCSGVV